MDALKRFEGANAVGTLVQVKKVILHSDILTPWEVII
jgi:hypothetical protein